ncbi:hypothetical protein DUI87_25977 [Hirundo rustica rustica]|uniref:ribonuclease H n=1 Tax=Hirundo rustica rustica TaxID=333673 RepID=A0A3M0JRM3_HIRRU|nr:hypothetical protein DUI87_25977 [Hirundo rustica rustica]
MGGVIGGVGFVNAPLTASEVRGFKKELGNLVEDPIETNLLGRDLQVQLGVGVIPKDGKMVVHIMKLTQGDIQEINPEVWATEGKDGCLDIPPIKIEMQKDTPAIRVKQYPMSPEGRKGLASVIDHLLKENILEPCMSPHNTPILAIKKDEGKFRLVQDLREINKRTIARHPVVPNPYTLLSKIPRDHTWFTVIDLKDAFWACPLAEECRDWFAFEWEHPDRGRKQQLRWTRLPQGYTESPNIFGQALETLLEQFSPKEGVQILQYVDDLLISGETEKEVKDGYRISQKKAQMVKQTVIYLGYEHKTWARVTGQSPEQLHAAAKERPGCLRAIAAVAVNTQEAPKFTLGQKMTVLVSHTVSAVLKVKGGHWPSPQRFLKYQAIMVEQDDVEIVVTNTVNPASFLSGSMGEPVIHECLEAIEATCSSCLDLKDTLLENTETWSTDGSSCVISGRHAGYVVTMSREVIESGPLPTNTSAQKAEITA